MAAEALPALSRQTAVTVRDLADPRELTLATYQALDAFRRSERLDDVIGLLERRGPLTLAFDLGDARSKDLHNRLHRAALIEGGSVRLLQGRSVFRLLTSSLAKLDSITEIVRAEHAALGDRLRMVILSDHIRAGELPANATDLFHPAKLGVIPIFETLSDKIER